MKWVRVCLLSTITCFFATATGIPQQTDDGPTWEVTSAWLMENIGARSGYAYSLTDTVSYNGPGLANGSVDTKNGSESVTFRVTSNATCHLNFSVYDRVTGYLVSFADMNVKSFDIDLSQSNLNSIKIQPFDLRSFVTSNFPLVTLKDYVDVVEVTPAAAGYWQILGLVSVAQDGSPNPPAAWPDGSAMSEPIVFTDQSTATRVAMALNHAVALCGGKPATAQPF